MEDRLQIIKSGRNSRISNSNSHISVIATLGSVRKYGFEVRKVRSGDLLCAWKLA